MSKKKNKRGKAQSKKHSAVKHHPGQEKHSPQQTIDAMMDVIANADNGLITRHQAAQQLGLLTASAFEGVQVHNRRVKSIPTLPKGMDENEFKAILSGGVINHEKAARALSYDLISREYTYRNIIKTYQDVLTYRNYFQPSYGDYDKNTLFREMTLLDKLQKKFCAEQALHEIAGRALLEGKVFAYHEYRVDKSHNKALENRLIPLPSDYCMIVDSNNPVSKYTLA